MHPPSVPQPWPKSQVQLGSGLISGPVDVFHGGGFTCDDDLVPERRAAAARPAGVSPRPAWLSGRGPGRQCRAVASAPLRGAGVRAGRRQSASALSQSLPPRHLVSASAPSRLRLCAVSSLPLRCPSLCLCAVSSPPPRHPISASAPEPRLATPPRTHKPILSSRPASHVPPEKLLATGPRPARGEGEDRRKRKGKRSSPRRRPAPGPSARRWCRVRSRPPRARAGAGWRRCAPDPVTDPASPCACDCSAAVAAASSTASPSVAPGPQSAVRPLRLRRACAGEPICVRALGRRELRRCRLWWGQHGAEPGLGRYGEPRGGGTDVVSPIFTHGPTLASTWPSTYSAYGKAKRGERSKSQKKKGVVSGWAQLAANARFSRSVVSAAEAARNNMRYLHVARIALFVHSVAIGPGHLEPDRGLSRAARSVGQKKNKKRVRVAVSVLRMYTSRLAAWSRSFKPSGLGRHGCPRADGRQRALWPAGAVN
ncbi:hypothetical protein CDD83_4778 [Cordyceps sp. RAO-2017]|nr:hypothetical protein CDD83_4778 [Cordyceps sp. RAO-2017]